MISVGVWCGLSLEEK